MPHSPWPAPEATVSRRGLLLGGVGLFALAGCSGDDSDDSGSQKNAPRGTPELAPDVAVATAALERIRATRAAVDAAYASAMAQGATTIRPAGPHPDIAPTYYGCVILDPDGNKLEIVAGTMH